MKRNGLYLLLVFCVAIAVSLCVTDQAQAGSSWGFSVGPGGWGFGYGHGGYHHHGFYGGYAVPYAPVYYAPPPYAYYGPRAYYGPPAYYGPVGYGWGGCYY